MVERSKITNNLVVEDARGGGIVLQPINGVTPTPEDWEGQASRSGVILTAKDLGEAIVNATHFGYHAAHNSDGYVVNKGVKFDKKEDF